MCSLFFMDMATDESFDDETVSDLSVLSRAVVWLLQRIRFWADFYV